MSGSVLEGCADGCGWIAAVTCVLAFGTFGVPIKTSVDVEVHPLVMQSYKTMTCFTTSFLVILLGENIRFSYWGIASGLFWVPGAACGIYGIRAAGMAVAVGTWSSIVVLTSFIFGIIIFQEKVKDFTQTVCAFVLLTIGLIGMSQYSAGKPKPEVPDHGGNAVDGDSLDDDRTITTMESISSSVRGACSKRFSSSSASSPNLVATPPPKSTDVSPAASPNPKGVGAAGGGGAVDTPSTVIPSSPASGGLQPLEIEPLVEESGMSGSDGVDYSAKAKQKDRIFLCGGRLVLTRRQLGVMGAVINGAWGGLNLIPMHYAEKYDNMTGASYLISYGTGALVVNIVIWILLIAYYLQQKSGNWAETIECLPKFHVSKLWGPGLCAGLLYSLGNFTSILAVAYLGQGVGFSFCQLQLLVSGLWGVFYFREIRDTDYIVKWFISAVLSVLGIIWLSYQHEGTHVHR